MKKSIALIICLTVSTLLADQMSKENIVPLGNVNGSTGNVFGKGQLRAVIINESFTKDSAYNGDDEVSDLKDRKMRGNITKFLLRYGLGYGFDIRAIVPYVDKKLSQTIPMGPLAGTRFDMKNSGIADMIVMSRYELLNQKKGDGLFLTAGAGIKLPTGDTDKSFDTPMGIKTSDDTQTMQLGSGSYDYMVELGATKILSNSRIDAYIMYQITNEGDNDYEFGNKLK